MPYPYDTDPNVILQFLSNFKDEAKDAWAHANLRAPAIGYGQNQGSLATIPAVRDFSMPSPYAPKLPTPEQVMGLQPIHNTYPDASLLRSLASAGAAGINAIGNMASGFTTPQNVAILSGMGGLGAIASAPNAIPAIQVAAQFGRGAAELGMGGQMAYGAGQGYQQAQTLQQNPYATQQQRNEAMFGVPLNLAMAYGMTKAGLGNAAPQPGGMVDTWATNVLADRGVGRGGVFTPDPEMAAAAAAKLTTKMLGEAPSATATVPIKDNILDSLTSWQQKGTPEQLKAHLAKTRGTKEEADWIGLDDFLKDKKSVTQQEVADFVKANEVQVTEKTRGELRRPTIKQEGNTWTVINPDGTIATRNLPNENMAQQVAEKVSENFTQGTTKFSSYQLPGGENYREVLFTLPYEKKGVAPREGETLVDALNRGHAENPVFKSSHFDEPNILLHTRVNDRVDTQGRKILFIEELQSDWHQKGRKEGYVGSEAPPDTSQWKVEKRETNQYDDTAWVRTPDGLISRSYPEGVAKTIDDARIIADVAKDFHSANKPNAVPDAPFKGEGWKKYGLKQMLKYAADNGYDGIGWTTGEQQAARYDLSKHIDSLKFRKFDDGTTSLIALDPDGRTAMNETVQNSKVADYVGKDMAEKIAKHDKSGATLSGLDLKVGGEGMKGFYDKELPNLANDITKKFGGRTGTTEISLGTDAPFEIQRFDNGEWQRVRGADSAADAQAGIDSILNRWGGKNNAEIRAIKEKSYRYVPVPGEQIHFLETPPRMRQEMKQKGLPKFGATHSPYSPFAYA